MTLFLLLTLSLALTACGAAANRGGTGATSGSQLEPADVGSAQCPASKFDDGSVYAQVAMRVSTCQVAARSDQARGASYAADGFSCTATTEGADSPWSSAWDGTYYAYSCADGSVPVAFN